MEGLPGAFLFVLGNDHGVFRWIAKDSHILDAFPDAADVLDDESHGPTDGGIGDIARA